MLQMLGEFGGSVESVWDVIKYAEIRVRNRRDLDEPDELPTVQAVVRGRFDMLLERDFAGRQTDGPPGVCWRRRRGVLGPRGPGFAMAARNHIRGLAGDPRVAQRDFIDRQE